MDARVSEDVCTRTPTAPSVDGPRVNPLIVIVNADAEIAAPEMVMTSDVRVVEPHVPVSPSVLLLPAAAVGVMEAAKNPEG